MMKLSLLQYILLFIFVYIFPYSLARCPFQNPFWFIDKPSAGNVFDENGEMVPNKIRVMWGRMENFECVDYFQIEYLRQTDPSNTLHISNKIDRRERFFDIEVIPCTMYYFKVVAAEDWNGLRDDFEVYSDTVGFMVKYTPQFILEPRFKEKRRMNFNPPPPPPQISNPWIDQTLQPTEEPIILQPKEEIFYNIRWRIKDIDYPLCLNHFELHYLDYMDYNVSKILRTVLPPFKKQKFLLQIQSEEFGAECNFDVQFIFKMYGIHRQSRIVYWTPPPCVYTTTTLPPPTSSTLNYTMDFNDTDGNFFSLENSNSSNYNFSMYDLDEDETPGFDVFTNESSESSSISSFQVEMDEDVISTTRSYAEEMKATRAQISSLKENYEKTGWQDFTVLKDSFFQSMKDFLQQMKAEDVEEDRVLFEDVNGKVCLSCGQTNGITSTGQCDLMEDGGLTNCSWPESCLEKDGIEDKCNVCIMAFRVVNINDQSNPKRCSKETIWNEMDLYSIENNNNNNNGDNNENKNNSFSCDISNDNNDDNSTKISNGQWNKACMCTGPDVNGSWIPCNSSIHLAFFNKDLTIFCILMIYMIQQNI